MLDDSRLDLMEVLVKAVQRKVDEAIKASFLKRGHCHRLAHSVVAR